MLVLHIIALWYWRNLQWASRILVGVGFPPYSPRIFPKQNPPQRREGLVAVITWSKFNSPWLYGYRGTRAWWRDMFESSYAEEIDPDAGGGANNLRLGFWRNRHRQCQAGFSNLASLSRGLMFNDGHNYQQCQMRSLEFELPTRSWCGVVKQSFYKRDFEHRGPRERRYIEKCSNSQ